MEPGTSQNIPRPGRALLHGQLTGEIIGAFFEVYKILKPGYLESTYAGAMALELTDRGIAFEREARLDVFYKGRVAGTYRPDFFVDGRVVVELKATRAVGEPEKRQLIHYITATNTRLGLLLHFGPEANFFRVINSRIRGARSATFRKDLRSSD